MHSPSSHKLAHASGASQTDKVTKVTWAAPAQHTGPTGSASAGKNDAAISITLNGTLVVAVAATALFASFVLSGVTFSLVNPGGAGSTSFNFTYTGTQSAAYIQGLLVSGSNITFNT